MDEEVAPVELPPKKDRTFFKSIRNYFREYCSCSSIHGFRYFGEKRSRLERVWWFWIFLMTLGGCSYFIEQVYRKWDEAPIIVSFATRETGIHQIPFPALTICPENKMDQFKYNYTELLEMRKLNMTSQNMSKIISHMERICNWDQKSNQTNATLEKFFDDSFYETIGQEIDVKKFFLSCSYMRKGESCSKLFKRTITDEGVCYTFNMLDKRDIYNPNVYIPKGLNEMETLVYKNWSLEEGYKNISERKTYPRRAFLSGARNGLTVILKGSKQSSGSCQNALVGFRALLHVPVRVPNPSQQYFTIPLNQMTVASVHPEMIIASNEVKNYKLKKRQCHLAKEKQLRFFKVYTQLNCKMECLTNITRNICGCVNFHMPRTNKTRICGLGRLNCMKKAENILIKIDLLGEEGHHLPFHCDCLPVCSDLTYHVETSQTDWNWGSSEVAKNSLGKMRFNKNKVHLAKLIVYFKSGHFIPSQREELYGPVAYLANFGGLISLFTGFSILSLMEIIYFLSIRICCNSILYGYWAGRKT